MMASFVYSVSRSSSNFVSPRNKSSLMNGYIMFQAPKQHATGSGLLSRRSLSHRPRHPHAGPLPDEDEFVLQALPSESTEAEMAKVWFCFEGDRPTLGDAQTERPLAELVELLRLNRDHYLGDDPTKVRFGKSGDPLGSIRGYQHVVVEVETEEARSNGWKRGYYHSAVKPSEANEKLAL